jgi:hypothetical protein
MTVGDCDVTLSGAMPDGVRSLDLPRESGPLVGRSREVAQARQLLSRSRLVTLTGVGAEPTAG